MRSTVQSARSTLIIASSFALGGNRTTGKINVNRDAADDAMAGTPAPVPIGGSKLGRISPFAVFRWTTQSPSPSRICGGPFGMYTKEGSVGASARPTRYGAPLNGG
jgi:hypothetical protein